MPLRVAVLTYNLQMSLALPKITPKTNTREVVMMTKITMTNRLGNSKYCMERNRF